MKRLLPLVLLVCLGIGCGPSPNCTYGAEFVLRAVPQRGERLTTSAMQAARSIISRRLERLGVKVTSVTIRGSDEIVVSWPSDPPTYIDDIAWKRGQLQLFDFEKSLAPPTVANGYPTPYTTVYALLSAVKAEAARGTPQAYYLFATTGKHRVMQGPAPTRQALLAPYNGKQPAESTILAVPANREVVSGPGSFDWTPGTKPIGPASDEAYSYLFKLPPALGGSDFNKSAISVANSTDVRADVRVGFTSHGAKAFQAITKAEYERGRLLASRNGDAGKLNPRYAQHVAIVLDGYIYGTPYIDYTDPSLSAGIGGGYAVIQHIPSYTKPGDLALILRTGSLPFVFKPVSPVPVCRR